MYVHTSSQVHNHSNSIEKLSKYFHCGQPLVAVIINGTSALNYLHKSIVQNGLL